MHQAFTGLSEILRAAEHFDDKIDDVDGTDQTADNLKTLRCTVQKVLVFLCIKLILEVDEFLKETLEREGAGLSVLDRDKVHTVGILERGFLI